MNKTISEIMDVLEDEGGHPGRRGAKRAFLHKKLADLAEKWYRRGFKRGHVESRKAFREHGTVPAKLRYEGSRELFTGQKRQVKVTSTAGRKGRKRP